MQNDPLSDVLSQIKNAERSGKINCLVRPASKIVGRILKIMQENGYIEQFELIEDGRAGTFNVKLLGRINNCGVIKPRYPVTLQEFEKFESRYLPAQDFGVIIVTTNNGVMSHYDAKKMRIGGKLLAYVY
jgi:small subunit ribosomal protein S8